jgi:2-keto-4-pentenoate hydratase
MTSDRITQAARLLVEAQRTNTPIAELPPTCAPRDAEEAFAIQDAVAALRGPVRGWKVGQGASPNCAPVFAVEPSGVTLEAARFHGLGAEIEFGFRVTEDLPPRATSYTDADVKERLEFVPLVELIASRYIDKKARTPFEMLADSLSNGAFVIGPPIADWQRFDFRNHPVSLTINGEVVQSVGGTAHKGHPTDGVVWLANRPAGLRAGDVITTGALKGATAAQAGDTVIGDWGEWGRVEVQFS